MSAQGWNAWSQHVLHELQRLNTTCLGLEKEIAALREDITVLKVKAGFWGLIAGTIPVVIMIAVNYLHK